VAENLNQILQLGRQIFSLYKNDLIHEQGPRQIELKEKLL